MSEGIHTLYGVYDSKEKDLVSSFYLPLFNYADKVDRISCYFSSKALSTYSRGLEVFGRKPNSKYRLIVSTQISEDDFNAIVEGKAMQNDVDAQLVLRLRETLTVEETNNLSNLAYLISLGIVEIKIAYVKKGTFHYKMGYAEDSSGKSILMIGSNNETEAAILDNCEMFIVANGEGHKYRFDKYWENLVPDVYVKVPSDLIWKEIMSYNTGRLVEQNGKHSPDNCIYLDYEEGELTIEVLLRDPPSNYNLIQLSKINRHVERYTDKIIFKKGRNYVDCEEVIRGISNYCLNKKYILTVSKALTNYIDDNNLLINQRRSLGLEIKRRDKKIESRYESYKAVVDSTMVRKLREVQMWDSFFMYTMKKVGNFSVPGSGKTSAVLGVFAYVRSKEDIKRLVVIGPFNCFDSWIGEYHECFGHDSIQIFDSRLNSGLSVDAQINNLLSTYKSKGIFLFNYESLSKYRDTIIEYLIEGSLLVFDEAHHIKGIETIRSTQSLLISEKSSRTIIVTGTPMPNSYVDLYNPLHVLFPIEYDSYFGYGINTLKNPGQSVCDDINRKLQPFYCRTTKDTLGVRPANPDKDVYCTASDLELKLYSEIVQRYRGNKLALIVRTLQLESDPRMLLDKLSDTKEFFPDDSYDADASHMLDLAPTIDDVEGIICKIEVSTKTKTCIESVRALVSEGKKVIVWCIFVKSIENISSLLDFEKITNQTIYGSTAHADRTSIIDSFKKGDFSVLVTNPHTLAESTSLHTVCHDAVYFEYSYNLVHLLQSKDRIHRLGLPDSQYTQYHFIKINFESCDDATHSLDDQIYQRLKDKEDMMIEAIESGRLEQASTPEEDIDHIYRKMGWS